MIRTAPDGYVLETPTDAATLEKALATAREVLRGNPQQASMELRGALSLWRSRPYPELDHVEEAGIEVRRLEDIADGAREALLAASC